VQPRVSKDFLTYGLRYSLFYRLGSSTVNIYENNSPVTFNTDLQIYEKAIPTGTKFIIRMKLFKQPRTKILGFLSVK
jgi:hypothetical protein